MEKMRIGNKLFWVSLSVILMIVAGCKKDDSSGPIIPVDPYVINETPFDSVPDTKDIVMYEVNFGAFSSSGNINGVITRLDSLKKLSINVIWLMPIHPIGTVNSVNSPYSVKNYTEVNPSLGTLADLRTLVSKAHDRNMAVIIDWVANHTAWDNPWITEHKDWYSQDSYGNIISPPEYGWPDVADLNYSNSEMRLEMIKSMKYWIATANIDGFRCDVADGIPFSFWKQAIDSLNAMPGRELIFLAEGTRDDHFTAGFQMNYGWDFNTRIRNVFAAFPADGIFTTDNTEYEGIPAGSHKLRYITNHDISNTDGSLIDLYGSKEASLAAFVITSYLHGVPLVYTGQEVGHPTKISFFTPNPVDWYQNPDFYSEYKNILNIRKSLDAVKSGSITPFAGDDIAVFKKVLGNEEILVMVNIRNSTTNYTLPVDLANTNWENLLDNSNLSFSSDYSFSPYEYLILKSQ